MKIPFGRPIIEQEEKDAVLNVLDLVYMVNLIISQNSFSDEMMHIIDANQDQYFNVLDAVIFVQLIVGR